MRLCTGCLIALCLARLPVARAEPLRSGVDDVTLEVGLIANVGSSEFAATDEHLSPNASGIVIRDRNGMSAAMVIGAVITILTAVKLTGQQEIKSSRITDVDKRVDGSTVVTVETKTTYVDLGTREEQSAGTNAMLGAIAAAQSEFELQLFSRSRFGFGDTGGFKLTAIAGGGRIVRFQTGLGFGFLSSRVEQDGMPVRIDWSYFGMPFRVSRSLHFAQLSLTYEWNWLKYGAKGRNLHTEADGSLAIRTASHPWHLDVSTVAFNRLALGIGVMTQRLFSPSPGLHVSGAFRF